MSIKYLDTNKVYPLEVGKKTIIGRGKFGISSPYVSTKQLEIDYCSDGRCFIKKLTDRTVLLNDGSLVLGTAYELENGDIINFGLEGVKIGKRAKFQLILPERSERLVRNIVRVRDKGKGKYEGKKENDLGATYSSGGDESDSDGNRHGDSYYEDRFDSQDEQHSVHGLSDESDLVY